MNLARRRMMRVVANQSNPILFSDDFSSTLSASWTNLVGTFETNSGKARGATIAADGNNLISNGEFTTNAGGWTAGNGAVLARRDFTSSPDIDPTGGTDNFGLEALQSTADYGIAFQAITTALVGVTYTMTAKCYSPSANAVATVGRITIRDGANSISTVVTGEDVWQTLTASRKITSNLTAWLISGRGTSNDLAYYDAVTVQQQASISTCDVLQANLDITCTITMPASGTTPFGFVIRLTDVSNYWLIRIKPGTSGGDLELVEVNAGVSTIRGSADIDWSVSTAYIINIRCYTNEYSVKVAGVEKIAYTDTGSFNITATKVGLFDLGVNNGLFDDLKIRHARAFGTLEFSRISEATLWSTSGVHDWLGRPLLVDDGTNFICIYRSAPGHGDNAGALVHIRFSANEGITWSDEDKTTAGVTVTGFPVGIVASAVDVSGYDLLVAPNGDLLAWLYHAEGANGGTIQYRSTDSGSSWSSDGRVPIDANTMIGGLDHCIVGTDIYMVGNYDTGGDQTHPWTIRCYKSTDNGATWSALTDVDAVNDGNESGICNPFGNRLVVLSRDTAGATTYQYVSEDLGLTWSSRIAVSTMAVFHRPMIRKFDSHLLAVGRDYVVGAERTVVYHSIDGTWWDRQFFPDADSFVDTGYCSVVQKSNGQFYMLSYAGTTDVASIVEYVFRLG